MPWVAWQDNATSPQWQMVFGMASHISSDRLLFVRLNIDSQSHSIVWFDIPQVPHTGYFEWVSLPFSWSVRTRSTCYNRLCFISSELPEPTLGCYIDVDCCLVWICPYRLSLDGTFIGLLIFIWIIFGRWLSICLRWLCLWFRKVIAILGLGFLIYNK